MVALPSLATTSATVLVSGIETLTVSSRPVIVSAWPSDLTQTKALPELTLGRKRHGKLAATQVVGAGAKLTAAKLAYTLKR